MTKVIALANQKGGVGKTTTSVNLGIGLARQGKKVLLVDADSQGNLTDSLGWRTPDELKETLTSVMTKVVTDEPLGENEAILHHEEGVDLLPSNIELSALEMLLSNTISRETIMRSYLQSVKHRYDYVLIDCSPSLGLVTVNALAAADSIIIPVLSHYLPTKGLSQLIQTINRIRRTINPQLEIEGVLLTMVDSRTNFAKDISENLRVNCGDRIPVFQTEIPLTIRTAEASATGTSIYQHAANDKAAKAYESLVQEVMANGK